MSKSLNLALVVALGATAGSAACAQILGVEPDAHLTATTTTTATGGGTTTTASASSCVPGDAGASTCGASRFCDPTSKMCVAACSGTLRIRITDDLSGTAQDIANPYTKGIVDYVRELNMNGGIRGCQIDYDVQDGHYDATVTHTVVAAWAAKPEWPEVNAIFLFGTGPTTNVYQMPEAAGKVIIPGSYAGRFTSPDPLSINVDVPDVNGAGMTTVTPTPKNSPGYPYIFFPATDYSTGIRAGIRAAWNVGAGKMAMVYDNTCAYCTDPLAAGKSYITSLPPMELAQDISNVPQTSDPAQIATIAAAIKTALDADIAKFKADPNYHPIKWLWCGNSVTSCAGVAKGAGQANADITAQITDASKQWKVRVMANNWGIGETSSSLCGHVGLAADCDDVLYGLFPVPRYGDTTNATGMQAMMDLHDKWDIIDKEDAGTGKYQDVRFVQGYAAALMWKKAVEEAIDAGHAKPAGADLKASLETFNQVDLQGMTAGPISFSKTDHRPQGNENIYFLHQAALTFQGPASLSLDGKWLGY